MQLFKEADIVANGKTKKILKSIDGCVIVQNKDDITKNDNPSETRTMSNKAEYATTTTCAVFSLLEKAGIPVAFRRQISPKEFLAPQCKMIPLEVIIRRYGVGSYLKRFPNFEKTKGENPHRFDRLVFEVFLKTTDGNARTKTGIARINRDGLSGIDDPLILNPYDEIWQLRHPKMPSSNKESELSPEIPAAVILPPGVSMAHIEELARKTFLALEYVWYNLKHRLIDFKIEFGIDCHGRLLVADVIDNDSWRLRTNDWQELSKQNFRDNLDIKEVADKYAIVAGLVQGFKELAQTVYVQQWYEIEETLYK